MVNTPDIDGDQAITQEPSHDGIRQKIEHYLGQKHLTTTDPQVFALINNIASERSIKTVNVTVTEKDFNSDFQLRRIFEEGLNPKILSNLKDRYNEDWFDQITFEGKLIDHGINPAEFLPLITIEPDVTINNPQYDRFSNNIRALTQSNPGFSTAIYSPDANLIHTELKVHSHPLYDVI